MHANIYELVSAYLDNQNYTNLRLISINNNSFLTVNYNLYFAKRKNTHYADKYYLSKLNQLMLNLYSSENLKKNGNTLLTKNDYINATRVLIQTNNVEDINKEFSKFKIKNKSLIFPKIFFNNFAHISSGLVPSKFKNNVQNEIESYHKHYLNKYQKNIRYSIHFNEIKNKESIQNRVSEINKDNYKSLLFYFYFLSGNNLAYGSIFYLKPDYIDELIIHSKDLERGLDFASDQLKSDKRSVIFIIKEKNIKNFLCLNNKLKLDIDVIYAALTSSNALDSDKDLIFNSLSDDYKEKYINLNNLLEKLINRDNNLKLLTQFILKYEKHHLEEERTVKQRMTLHQLYNLRKNDDQLEKEYDDFLSAIIKILLENTPSNTSCRLFFCYSESLENSINQYLEL